MLYRHEWKHLLTPQGLMALAIITTPATLAVTSNMVLPLGVAGALSIVRFREAIKELRDIILVLVQRASYWGRGCCPCGRMHCDGRLSQFSGFSYGICPAYPRSRRFSLCHACYDGTNIILDYGYEGKVLRAVCIT